MGKGIIALGTQYSINYGKVCFIGKTEVGVHLIFDGGAETYISVTEEEDRDRQYDEMCKIWGNVHKDE